MARTGLRNSWFPLPGYLSGVLLSFPAVGEAPRTLSPHRGGLPLPGRGIAIAKGRRPAEAVRPESATP